MRTSRYSESTEQDPPLVGVGEVVPGHLARSFAAARQEWADQGGREGVAPGAWRVMNVCAGPRPEERHRGPQPRDGRARRGGRPRLAASTRRHVLDVAFRMLGNLAEAEDVVQEAYAPGWCGPTWTPSTTSAAGSWSWPAGSAFDRLRAERRHPTAPDRRPGRPGRRRRGSTRPTGSPSTTGTAWPCTSCSSRLTAAERTAFVLHDVFQYPFEAITKIVGRSRPPRPAASSPAGPAGRSGMPARPGSWSSRPNSAG